MSITIAALGERALIERLRRRVGSPPAHVLVGIGDDAAVLAPPRNAVSVLTTDCLVEGVHFRREWTAARAIGHKALAVSLSDLASMGATPTASLLSLALPASLPLDEFDGLIDGFGALADASGAALVGGNLAASPGPVVVDVTAVGQVHPRRVLTRHGARPGDELWVTGTIGAAAAGLAMRAARLSDDALDAGARECVRRYEQPDARTRCGPIAAKSAVVSAAMDLSDGLASVAQAMTAASGVGVTIDASALPIHAGVLRWAAERAADPIEMALSGGEDYELAFAVPSKLRRRFLAAMRRVQPLPVTCVGRFEREPGVWLARDGSRRPIEDGFGHFTMTESPAPA